MSEPFDPVRELSTPPFAVTHPHAVALSILSIEMGYASRAAIASATPAPLLAAAYATRARALHASYLRLHEDPTA